MNGQKSLGGSGGEVLVNAHGIVLLLFLSLFDVFSDEGLSSTNLPALTFLTGSVVSHVATTIIIMFLLVDVRLFALLALNVVVLFIVVASASSASDGTTWVDFVTILPAMVALDEFDLLCPFRNITRHVEKDQRVSGEDLERSFVWVSMGGSTSGRFTFTVSPSQTL